MKTPAWLTAQVLLRLGVAVAIMLALWGGYRLLTANPKAEANLARNQTEAAAESGSEAVNTVGKAADREAASDALTRDNERTIRDAEGSDATVAAPARDAGLASLCKRRAYSRDPRCVQHVNPR